MARWAIALVVLISATGGEAAFADAKKNPISKVADLLQGLAKKVENDGKIEEEMYETYVCWYKTVTSSKKATNAAATERIANLDQYIKDIESGKIEFTDERATLEKEIADLEGEIKAATEERNTEERDFLAAKEEMEMAIESLGKAVKVLGDATGGASLASFKGELNKAVDIGQTFLSKADVDRLSKALEDPDWFGMTNDHNMKYKAASSKIQDILKDMLDTFEDNLKDAEKLEGEKKATFETLMSSKEAQLSSSKAALAAGDVEGGARTLNADEAKAEKELLEEQVDNDKGFIEQVEAAYTKQTEEWKERCRLRTEEIASIMEAVSVLTSDEARDVTKKSYESQGVFFLQDSAVAKTDCERKRVTKAKDALRKTAASSKDIRVSMLFLEVASASQGKAGMKFDKVVKALEKMMEDLHKESDDDLEIKETCEKDRDDLTATARRMTYAIDDQTSIIVRKEHQVDELNAKIDACNAAIADALAKLAEAQAARNAEHKEFKASKADDEAAQNLVKKASEALSKFYNDNGLALVQAKKQPVVVAGEAPPPPPPMFPEPYGGAKGENNGIQAILSMIEEDIGKDIAKATAEEDAAQAEFDAFKKDTEDFEANQKEEITGYEKEISECDDAIKDARTTRGDKKETLEGAMKTLRSIAGKCDFMAANFEYRKQIRYEEIDGLLEAQAALQGGSTAAAKAMSAASLVQDGC